jgi:replicative DNA helicase
MPPSNVQAEQALLGSLLTNNSRTADRCEFLRAEYHYDPIHASICARAMERIVAGKLADAQTLTRGAAPIGQSATKHADK